MNDFIGNGIEFCGNDMFYLYGENWRKVCLGMIHEGLVDPINCIGPMKWWSFRSFVFCKMDSRYLRVLRNAGIPSKRL
jgi:hypothetical protein